ncbi:unnamed protein product [Orchesella dallaii]|uniref:Gustatory receptor n=1 Tax=Orchesella dallaii TaxID=48710 RepID=A0ABP1Q378_9HEXA
MLSSTVSPASLRKILILDKITVRILDKLSALQGAVWVDMPTQWDGKLKRLYVRPPSETFFWNVMQFFNFLGAFYYLSFLFLTWKYDINVETWKVLFFTLVIIATYCVDLVYFAIARKYREMAACTKAVLKLPKGFSSLITTTRNEAALIELVSTGVLVFFFSIVFGVSIGCLLSNLDPIIILLEEFLEDPLPLRLFSSVILFIFACNFIFCVDNYMFLLVFWLTRIVLAELAVKCPQNIKSWIRRGAFRRAIRIHTLSQFLFIFVNEIGSVAHPCMYALGFFGLIVTGTATVMAKSFLSVSLFPGMFCILLSWVLTVSSYVVAIHDQSILFKLSWVKEVEGKLARMQLRACKEAKWILNGMGFLDRSFVSTFIDGVIKNLVNLVILAGGN